MTHAQSCAVTIHADLQAACQHERRRCPSSEHICLLMSEHILEAGLRINIFFPVACPDDKPQ